MENFIYTYTRKQAITDGQQINTDSLAANLSKEAGIKYPVFITASVKKIIDEALNYGCNDLQGILWDIFTMLKLEAKKSTERVIDFEVFIYWCNKSKKFIFYAEIGAYDFDNPEPAITIMTINDL